MSAATDTAKPRRTAAGLQPTEGSHGYPRLRWPLAFDDVDDFARLRPNDHVATMHQDELIAAPFRIDLDDQGRKRMEAHRGGKGRSDRDVHVNARADILDLLRPDRRSDLSALFSRRRRGGRGRRVA